MLLEAGNKHPDLSVRCSDLCAEFLPDRTVVVEVADGVSAVSRAVGRFIPALSLIQLDLSLVADLPLTANTKLLSDGKYRSLTGVLIHEMAHAAFSPAKAPPTQHARTLALLEESRVEWHWTRRHPSHTDLLAHTATEQILSDYAPTNEPVYDLASVLLLVMARHDIGVLTPRDIAPIRNSLDGLLLAKARGLWQRSFATGHDDLETRMAIAQEFDELLATQTRYPGMSSHSVKHMADSVSDRTSAPVKATLSHQACGGAGPPSAEPQADADAGICGHLHASTQPPARTAQGGSAGASGQLRHRSVLTRRPPTAAERRELANLNRKLRQGRSEVTEVDRPQPPGRLVFSRAVRRRLQVLAGEQPTVAPWTFERETLTNPPPIHLAIIQDVSASMKASDRGAAQLVWALQNAELPAESKVVHIAFGTAERLVPASDHVRKFVSRENTASFHRAAALATREANLGADGARSVVVVISDGEFHRSVIPHARVACRALQAAGAAMFWVDHKQPENRPQNTEWLPLADPFLCSTNVLVNGSHLTAA